VKLSIRYVRFAGTILRIVVCVIFRPYWYILEILAGILILKKPTSTNFFRARFLLSDRAWTDYAIDSFLISLSVPIRFTRYLMNTPILCRLYSDVNRKEIKTTTMKKTRFPATTFYRILDKTFPFGQSDISLATDFRIQTFTRG